MANVLCLGTQDIRMAHSGGQRSVYGSLSALATAGEQLCYCVPHRHAFDQPIAAGLHMHAIAAAPREGPAALWCSLRFGLPYKFGKYSTQRFIDAAIALGREIRADWIFLHGAHLAYAALQIRRALDIPLLLREHNLEYELVRQYSLYGPSWLRVPVRWQEQRTRHAEQALWRACERVLFISDGDLQQALREGEGNFSRVYDGVSVDTSSPVTRNGDFLLSGGMHTPQNRHALRWFLRAVWVPFAKRYAADGVRLSISGLGIRDFLQHSGLDRAAIKASRIDLPGFVRDFRSILRSHRYFISPTTLGSGYRVKVAEAGGSASCVFLTAVDCRSLDFLRPAQNCLCFSEYEDFCMAYESVRTTPRLALELGQALRAVLTREMRWDHHASQILQLRGELL